MGNQETPQVASTRETLKIIRNYLYDCSDAVRWIDFGPNKNWSKLLQAAADYLGNTSVVELTQNPVSLTAEAEIKQTTKGPTKMKLQENQLTASKLIEHLQKAIADRGDLPVRFHSDTLDDVTGGNSLPVVGFVTMMNDDDTPDYFLIGDDDLLDILDGLSDDE
jgi:hypothetical protein